MFIRLLSRRAFASRMPLEWEATEQRLWKHEITPQKALESYRLILGEGKKEPELLSQFALRLYRLGSPVELQVVCNSLTKVNPVIGTIFCALSQSATVGGKSALMSVIRDYSKMYLTPLEHRYLSIVYQKCRKPTHALKSLNKYFSLESSSSDLFAIYERFLAELRCREFASALKSCDYLLQIYPQSFEMRYRRASALFGCKRQSDAILELSRLMDSPLNKTQRAFLLQKRSDFREEDLAGRVEDLKRAHALCPELGCDRELLVLYYERQMLDDEAKVLDRIGKSNDYVPEIVRADMNMYSKKDYEAAKKGYERAYELAVPEFKSHLKHRIENVDVLVKRINNNKK